VALSGGKGADRQPDREHHPEGAHAPVIPGCRRPAVGPGPVAISSFFPVRQSKAGSASNSSI
jgi:hypothetical protein